MASRSCLFLVLPMIAVSVTSLSVGAQTDDFPVGIIDTVAGGGIGDRGPASEATLYVPAGMALGPDGSLYISDSKDCRVRKIDPAGKITTVAGNGHHGHSGDGGPATEACLAWPSGVAVGLDGSLYIADSDRIRKVDRQGIISTVAGSGEPGPLGDGGPATSARLSGLHHIALGPDGGLYIADTGNNRIRKVDPAGVISTVAGGGNRTDGRFGDGGPATEAILGEPLGIAIGPDGSIYIADSRSNNIRKVHPNGIITTVAGTGYPYHYSGDGGPAIKAALSRPSAVALCPDGSIYIADTGNARVRKVDTDGIINTVAGGGKSCYGVGEGGRATDARLGGPRCLALGSDGSIYIAGISDRPVRRIDPAGTITTVVGDGLRDGGPALDAALRDAEGVAVGPDGSLYIADTYNHRVRKVDSAGGITTVAGGGIVSPRYPVPRPATAARLLNPHSVTVGTDGSLYIADGRIAKVDPDGIIATVAGGGPTSDEIGDGRPATRVRLGDAHQVALGPDGSIYVADYMNHRIRKVDPAGIITTIAGDGNPGHWGDGGRATEAGLYWPTGVALDADGTLYIADRHNQRVRRVRWLPSERNAAKAMADDLRVRAQDRRIVSWVDRQLKEVAGA